MASKNIPISLGGKLLKNGFVKFGKLSISLFSVKNDKADGISANPILSVRVVKMMKVNKVIIFIRYKLNKRQNVFHEWLLNKTIILIFFIWNSLN